MTLSTNQFALLDRKLLHQKKTAAVGYLFLLGLGVISAHRLYLGKSASALAQVELLLLGLLTLSHWQGIVLILVWASWMLYDLFALPAMVNEENLIKREEVLARMIG